MRLFVFITLLAVVECGYCRIKPDREEKAIAPPITDGVPRLYDGSEFYHTTHYEFQIVDRVGEGDSYASRFIYGLVTGKSMKDSAGFGVAASALKHTIPGNMNHATLKEVEALMKGDASGRVSR